MCREVSTCIDLYRQVPMNSAIEEAACAAGRAVSGLLILLLLSGCSPHAVSPDRAGSADDLSSGIRLPVSEADRQRRMKYGVRPDLARSGEELRDQIFADDDVDPFSAESLRLKALALDTRSLGLQEAGGGRSSQPYGDEEQLEDRQRFDLALRNLGNSTTFRDLFSRAIEPVLASAHSRIIFNNQGINCGGSITREPFHETSIGLALYLDLRSEIRILTTRGIQAALPERLIAHELIESTQCRSPGSHLSGPDPGLLEMDVVLQVNRIMRELREAGILGPLESAARIRYWR